VSGTLEGAHERPLAHSAVRAVAVQNENPNPGRHSNAIAIGQ
jgi:hypothetical protein